MRSSKVYLEDIIESIRKIEGYLKNIKSFEQFLKKDLIIDGTIRNLEVIGEAVKNLPREYKEKYSDIEWKKIAGLRDILTHAYFGVDLKIIWDLVKNKLPKLKQDIIEILKNIK